MLRQEETTTASNKPTIKIAIVDYQSCAFSPENKTDKHFLSKNLITFLSGQGYTSFVGHTMRCLVNSVWFLNKAHEHVAASEYAKFDKNYPIEKITKHIEKHAGVMNLTVVTLDDMVSDRVGSGFDALKAFEKTHEMPDITHVDFKSQFELMKQNNLMLLKIAKYLADTFPGQQIQIDVYDDDLKNCEHAHDATSQPEWPESVKLNKVYRYSAKLKDDRVIEVTNPSHLTEQSTPRKASHYLTKHVMFDPTVQTTTFTSQPPLRRSLRLSGKDQPDYTATRINKCG